MGRESSMVRRWLFGDEERHQAFESSLMTFYDVASLQLKRELEHPPTAEELMPKMQSYLPSRLKSALSHLSLLQFDQFVDSAAEAAYQCTLNGRGIIDRKLNDVYAIFQHQMVACTAEAWHELVPLWKDRFELLQEQSYLLTTVPSLQANIPLREKTYEQTTQEVTSLADSLDALRQNLEKQLGILDDVCKCLSVVDMRKSTQQHFAKQMQQSAAKSAVLQRQHDQKVKELEEMRHTAEVQLRVLTQKKRRLAADAVSLEKIEQRLKDGRATLDKMMAELSVAESSAVATDPAVIATEPVPNNSPAQFQQMLLNVGNQVLGAIRKGLHIPDPLQQRVEGEPRETPIAASSLELRQISP